MHYEKCAFHREHMRLRYTDARQYIVSLVVGNTNIHDIPYVWAAYDCTCLHTARPLSPFSPWATSD